ncbi:chorismate mutase [Streptomyces sp. NPDC056361]|uniref:chorismate mutase n=1 Tax=Streptomyces sp. NPDC056361 TaxID=3345795 RepID=UPI0035D71F41
MNGHPAVEPTGPTAAPPASRVLALRGATQAASNDPDEIVRATTELLREIVTRNALDPADLISIWFTASPDLTAAYPARAAREMGFVDVPLMCASEIDVPGGSPRAVRVLIHTHSSRPRASAAHVYLHGAAALRPDLVAGTPAAGPAEL